jgi:hypothetical protein
VAFPEFMGKKEVVLELDVDGLRSFVKSNVFRDADVEVVDGKVYIKIPLELLIPYEVKENRILLKIPVK